jgi:hypothetical protein
VLNPKSGLYEVYTAALMNEREFPHQSSGMFRPSEASATIQAPYGPKVLGACKRRTWYRLKGIPAKGETLPYQIQRMNVGKQVENAFIETCKRAGVYVANNVKFRAEMKGIPIAGEMDAVLRTTPCGKEKYVAEVKSIYGYYPQKEILGKFIGTGREDGRPRDSYVMQIALYLYQFSRLPEDDPSYLPFGAIFVADRGDGHYGAFDVWLEKELKILGEDEVQSVHNIYYSSSSMGIYRTKIPYTVEDILNSYRAIQVALAIDKPLPRDFIREYNREQIEERHAAGEISANNYKKWMSSHGPRGKGKEKLGDFHCYKLYCGWSDYCWSCEN